MWWCSPIIWHDNINLPEDLFSSVCELVSGKVNDKPEYYTTYGKRGLPWKTGDRELLTKFYHDLFRDKMMPDLGLNHRSDWLFHYWIQATNSKSKGHKPHSHFSGMEIISWCHVIKTLPSQKCFHFYKNSDDGGISILNHTYEKQYPEIISGDINAWPSWSLHGVDPPNSDEERIVIAGNIGIESITDGESMMRSTFEDPITTWKIDRNAFS